MWFTDKVAIVTGTGSGIGRATALGLAREGAAVVVADIYAADRGGRRPGRMVETDVSDTDASSHVVDTALQAYVGLDVAVNNAGMLEPFMPTADVPVDGRETPGAWFSG